MNKLKRIYDKATGNPFWVASVILRRCLSRWITDDKTYIKWEYFFGMHKFPDLKHPTTFTEKIQWLKLNNRKPEYTRMVDKAKAKEYVAEVLGTTKYNIPTLGVWKTFDEIDFDRLPQQFVLKTTHDSGGIVICRAKDKLDIGAARRKLEKSLRHDYYMEHREWPYKHVEPRILAEVLMTDNNETDLKDYKFFCFNGKPLYCQVITGRNTKETIDFFDKHWNHQEFFGLNPIAKQSDSPIAKPEAYTEMLDIARRLSHGHAFLRVDLYYINNKVYFGELTFSPAAGIGVFTPNKYDFLLGEMICLE